MGVSLEQHLIFYSCSSVKINSFVKLVIKGSEASLFVDDSAICMHAKPLPHAERLMQLCVKSVLGWVSNHGFKFSIRKTCLCLVFFPLS